MSQSPDQRFQSLAHWGAFTAVVRDGRLAAVEPFARDPLPSPMLNAMPGMVHSPLRIARPAVREGWLKHRDRSRGPNERFVEVSWDAALRLVADEVARVRAEHGHRAIFGGSKGWASAGRFHHAPTLTKRFYFTSGGCVDALSNYSWGAAQYILPHVIGTHRPVDGRATQWPSLIKHTRLIIAFGGLPLKNGQVTSGGAGDHSLPGWLRKAAEAGIEFVCITPARRDAPPMVRPQWIAIRPGTDTAVMLAMAHTLLVESLHDQAFLDRYTEGFARFRGYVLGETDATPKSADWAAAITGVPADTIRVLARRAAATRTMVTTAWSLQRARYGEQVCWMTITLAAMLGQIGLPGGGFGFGHGSMNGVGNPRLDIPAPEMGAGPNPIGESIPCARVTDLLLNPGQEYDFNGKRYRYPDIRLVHWAGGNPFHHHQDLNRLRAGWARPDTVVVHDSWWTPTARQADIVLPATTVVERNDIGGSSRDRYVFAMQRAIAPVGQARNDWEIYRELSARLGHEEAFTGGRDERGWLVAIYDKVRANAADAGVELPPFEDFWRRGHVEIPPPAKDFVLFESFRDDPQTHRLATPSGRIEITSEVVARMGYDDCPAHPTWLAPEEWLGAGQAQRFPLQMLSVQPSDKLHSQMDAGIVSRQAKLNGRTRLRMHPATATARGLARGDVARVYNDRGACLASVELDDGLHPAVVILPTGSWYDPGHDTLERHGNPNVLTPDVPTSRLAQAASAQSTLVEVERFAGEVPAVRAFDLPSIAAAG